MRTHEEDTGANGPRYASLTAGLLARKGEAVPAAAAFTAEAIAQHIPARRLAQEAERVLNRGAKTADPEVEAESFEDEVEAYESEDDDALYSYPQLKAHEAFMDGERPNGGQTPRERIAEAQTLLDTSANLGLTPEPTLPSDVEDEQAADFGSGPQPVLQEVPRGALPPGAYDPSSIPSLEDSEENWFEEIVSKAISEAEDHRAENMNLEPAKSPDDSAELEGIVADAKISGRSVNKPSKATVCSDKATQVRNAIRSGGPRAAAKSAMRLDPRRFIRLSLAAQKLQLSNQELMMAALDNYLDTLDDEVFSECACMKKGLI